MSSGLKISSSSEHWVNDKFTLAVQKGTITVDDSKVRDGAGGQFQEIRALSKGEEVFIEKTDGGWSKLVLVTEWVSSSLIDMQA